MDNNEKKAKRPRIGEMHPADATQNDKPRYERIDYSDQARSENNAEQQNHYGQTGGYNRPYQQRPYNRQGGYNNYNSDRQGGYNNPDRQQGGYNRQQGGYNNNRQGGYNNNRQGGYNRPYQQRPYQQRPYQQRPYNNFNNNQDNYTPAALTDATETGAADAQPTQQPQQPSYNNYNRQGGYNNRQEGYNNNRQGGYNNRYGNNRQQGGYNNNRYGNNRQQGGYNNNRYGNNRQQGGYNNNRYGNNHQQGGYNQVPRPGKSFTPRPKRVEYEMPVPDPNEEIRLNKYMANAGICSRREADEFIQQGLVKVNGNVVTELGTKITHADTVEYDEKVVTLENKCYILLNKPKDCVTTSDDPNGRTTVLDLVKGACNERIYPVGRLDRNTTGVLLLTNDGDLASKLTHPKYIKKKIYHVWTDKDISEEDMQRIADGIELEDGEIHADAISYATETDRNQAGIEIHSGRNRIVRRIFESLGYHVTKLDRVYFAGLTKKNLPRGRWRYLTQEEVNYLKMGSFE